MLFYYKKNTFKFEKILFPTCSIVINSSKLNSCMHELSSVGLCIIGLINTNQANLGMLYPIPANDLKKTTCLFFIKLFLLSIRKGVNQKIINVYKEILN